MKMSSETLNNFNQEDKAEEVSEEGLLFLKAVLGKPSHEEGMQKNFLKADFSNVTAVAVNDETKNMESQLNRK